MRLAPASRHAAVLLCLALSSSSSVLAQQQKQPPRRPPARAAAKADSTRAADSSATAKPAEVVVPRAPSATLFGTVFDSVHMSPLADARVMVEGTNRSTITTDKGVFRVDSIPPGTYKVRVDHVMLDSLGMTMITNDIELKDGAVESVQLTVPSGATLVEVSCPAARRALGPSAIIGRLLDADTEQPVKGGRVSVVWEEMSINAGLRRVPRRRDALAGEDGVYRICGLPNAFEGTLQADFKGITTSEVRVKFEGDALVVQGLKIGSANTVAVSTGDSATRRMREAAVGKSFSAATLQKGSARLTGRVLNAAGAPIVGARVDVLNTAGMTLTGEGGVFRLDSLPSGTQSVVVRQIGLAPVEQAVELSTRQVADMTITMSRAATVLAEVRVEAQADAGLEKVGFTQRKKSGFGYFLNGDDITKRAPNLLTDVFRTIPGLRVVPSGTDYVVQSSRNMVNGCVRYFVDGAVWEAIFPGDVDRLVPPWEIGAIEVYNGTSVPAQFQMAGSTSCAAIVIWTKTRLNAPSGRDRNRSQ
ncbi:MAG: carboxypeptidase regulatory-like domain-containing protein [Gemmatimonadaceae bacterium]|nr:carboxypeptidase regulatory-like domain-containing protein [Gemmatimonadaceae bacterium]